MNAKFSTLNCFLILLLSFGFCLFCKRIFQLHQYESCRSYGFYLSGFYFGSQYHGNNSHENVYRLEPGL